MKKADTYILLKGRLSNWMSEDVVKVMETMMNDKVKETVDTAVQTTVMPTISSTVIEQIDEKTPEIVDEAVAVVSEDIDEKVDTAVDEAIEEKVMPTISSTIDSKITNNYETVVKPYVSSQITEAINNLDSDPMVAGEGQLVESVSEEDGKVKVNYTVDYALPVVDSTSLDEEVLSIGAKFVTSANTTEDSKEGESNG